ncbi:MAG: hypothetical protein ACKOSS_04540, partial [Planctomycetia bacterium]
GQDAGRAEFVSVPGGSVWRVPTSEAARAVRAGGSEAGWRVLLAMVNGLDERQAAKALGKRLGTVKTQGRMARQKASRITGVDFEGGSASKRLVLVLVGFLPAPGLERGGAKGS